MSSPLSYLLVYDMEKGIVSIRLEDESVIDAAVERHISSGGTQDTLLLLTTTSDTAIKIRASRISNWLVTTPESRAKSRAFDAAIENEAPPEWTTGVTV